MHFNTPVIFVGQADVNQSLLCHMAQTYPVIALDGAVDMTGALGLTAELVIGDMDSVQDSALAKEQMKISEQDSNDFEKALYSIKAPLVIGFGLFGKRFDHTMANLQIMAKYHLSQKIVAITNHEIITTHQGATMLQAGKGEAVSVLPLMPIHFAQSDGLLYELTGISLSLTQMVSSSNQAQQDKIRLMPDQADEGVVYAVCRSLALLADHTITEI